MKIKKILKTAEFIDLYKDKLNETILKIDKNKLTKIIKLVEKKIRERKKIFTCGNGGSASIANHFICDFNKAVKEFSNNKIKPKVISLSNSVENITAISNDISFNEIFSNQIENFCEKGDCLIALSCSGKSNNILKVLKLAKKKWNGCYFYYWFFKFKKC